MAAESKPGGEQPVPPSVRWIRAGRDALESHGRWVVAALVGLSVVWMVLGGIYTVDNGESAARLRFGALQDDTIGSGLHFRLPSRVEKVIKAATSEVTRLEIRGDEGAALSLLTSDENLIDAQLVVQYRIDDLGRYLFAADEPAALLAQAVRGAVVEAVASTPVDEILTSAKGEIQNRVRQQTQDRLETYGCGLSVVSVSLQSINPPREVSSSFRAVSDSRAEAAKAINSAQEERDRAIRLARGEAERTMSTARAAANTRVQRASGSAERFRALLRQLRVAPDQTRAELYFGTLREVLPAARLIVLAPGESPEIGIHLLPEQTQTSNRSPAIPPGVSFDDR